MPYENKLVFFDFEETISLTRHMILAPDDSHESIRLVRLTPLKRDRFGELVSRRQYDSEDAIAVKFDMINPASLATFDQVFNTDTLLELMIKRMIEKQNPMAKDFPKRVLTSDFHLCLEISNMPVQREIVYQSDFGLVDM